MIPRPRRALCVRVRRTFKSSQNPKKRDKQLTNRVARPPPPPRPLPSRSHQVPLAPTELRNWLAPWRAAAELNLSPPPRVRGKSINPVGWRPSRFNLSASFYFFWNPLPPTPPQTCLGRVRLQSLVIISHHSRRRRRRPRVGKKKKTTSLLFFFQICKTSQTCRPSARHVVFISARRMVRGKKNGRNK